ncbi:MAG: tannase/feruloyl esterase family alpha/beta hydrolase [Acidobacteria bacterium]|nr:tannase/feruloyl esterase family alpha/beta hydrolase [Acidobacteriota bacterium]
MAGAAAALILGSTAMAADCAGLAKLQLPQTEITAAEAVEGSFTTSQKQKLDKLPAFCRVAGVLRPSPDSHIEFEVWLPQSGWNGKFQGIGNGGFAGSISYAGLADAVRAGYASASTDTGHRAGGQDARWALDHPEKVVDFGHRAIHEMTVKGKAITEAFYGGAPKRSYFSSCSNGGRQALMEAQRYPADYDGIVAGAPANYWTTLMINAAYMSKETMYTPGAYVPASKLPAISQAALAACDAQDGVKDGVIGNPPACRFDPAVLLCKGEENDQCLTAAQLKSLKTIYEGTTDSKGKKLASGYAPGGEQEQGGWGPWITGTAPEKSSMYAFSTNFFKFIVHSKSDWDLRTFDLDRDAKLAIERGAKALNADSADLAAFRARGGKLLLYHGWSDAAIPGQHVINYYQSVIKKMGAANVESFSRLYMAPGVQHCGAGSGPNVFGQFGVAKETPETNIAAALEQWVEKGTAPGSIVATKFKMNGQPTSGVERTRPLCPYPMVAKYKGSGSTDEAANFTCAK